MSGHVFVDESKHGEFLLIASVVLPADVTSSRKKVQGLVLRGQQRIHMKTESTQRKRLLLGRFTEFGFTATIYRAGTVYKRDLDRREACIGRLVGDLVNAGETLLCLESDETLDARDKRQLYNLTRQHQCQDKLRYQHQRAAQEPLLAIPDVIGWAWAKGGEWRRLAEPMVTRVIDV